MSPGGLRLDRATTVLLVVDVQTGMVDAGPWEIDRVLGNIAALIETCRDVGVEVVFVQHDGRPGELEEPGTPGWEIHRAVAPAQGERVVRKAYNSAFRDTDLRASLDARGIRTLIVVGIQTEYCVDTTVRVAFEFGYRVLVPGFTNTTLDNGDVPAAAVHRLVNERIFSGRFAETPSVASVRAALQARGTA